MYKCAIVGVGGGRARGHAEAYKHIRRGRLAAVSTRRQEKLDAFGGRYEVEARYASYRELFEREKPDLVHVNTPPNVRLEVFEAADEVGVPALIVEKPVAIQGEDYLAIRRFAARSSVKIAVNHQLHFHPRRAALQNLVRDGAIGDVRFVDASAHLNLAYQGTHVLQSIAAFNRSGIPRLRLRAGRGCRRPHRQRQAALRAGPVACRHPLRQRHSRTTPLRPRRTAHIRREAQPQQADRGIRHPGLRLLDHVILGDEP